MPSTFGIRLSDDERALIDAVAKAAEQPGDRGGPSGWARRVLLREAKRVVDVKAEADNVSVR